MKGIKLTENISYLHCTDPEGNHGVMTLNLGPNRTPKVASIEDQAGFKFWFNQFRKQEATLLTSVVSMGTATV